MHRKPNIILIVADDMGYGDCGCYGAKTIDTPHIDALATAGLRFTDFHANGAVCSPTRAALLTGRYQQRSGIEGVISAANHRHLGLPVGEVTFADLLQAGGYQTALFGKWHLGYEALFNPRRRGFDEFRGFVSGNIDYHSHIDQIGAADWWLDEGLVPEDGYTTDLVTQHGIRFMREQHNAPFCLYLAHECPHYPYQGPTDTAYRTPGCAAPIQGPRQDKMQAYKEMMEAMDAGIGAVVETVKALGLERDTLIFFFSDNGPAGPGSAGPLRGKKGSVWEGGHRVPALACWPGVIPAGSATAVPAMGMDLLPTMMAAAGLARPANLVLDGENLLPLMQGNGSTFKRPLFWRFNQQQAVRLDQWKLVINGAGARGVELFDLDHDLAEAHNIASEHGEVVTHMQHLLAGWEREFTSVQRLT